jgi:hypothetical protein
MRETRGAYFRDGTGPARASPLSFATDLPVGGAAIRNPNRPPSFFDVQKGKGSAGVPARSYDAKPYCRNLVYSVFTSTSSRRAAAALFPLV